MPAKKSGRGKSADDQPTEPQPEGLSRAERRAAARGRSTHDQAPQWGTGKVTGPKGAVLARKQFSNRRSGGG